MFYIAESDIQLNLLERYNVSPAYLEVISSNDLLHPKLSSTLAVYIRPLDLDRGFILPIDHPEGLNIGKDRVYELLKSFKELFVYDRKNVLYHFNLPNTSDVGLIYCIENFDKLDVPSFNDLNWFYNKFTDYTPVNKFIPISKLFERSEKNFDYLKEHCKEDKPISYDFYNTVATNVFFLIEQTGLGIYYEAYKELFSPRDPKLNTFNNTVYTSYNLYNVTSRPTNSFNSVNYAAIPKTPQHRKSFKPTNDFYVEFDFDGYHLRLLAEQIDFELSSESAHKQLAKLYFDKDEITDEEYAEAKQINFQAIYGKIPTKLKKLEIFVKIQKFIDEIWNEFKHKEYLAPISSRPFNKKLKGMHSQKLMNYVMQSLETSRNVLILKEVLKYLKNKKTKIALYTYDAILFDFSKEDGKETLNDIEKIMSQNDKYPVKFKFSKDLVL